MRQNRIVTLLIIAILLVAVSAIFFSENRVPGADNIPKIIVGQGRLYNQSFSYGYGRLQFVAYERFPVSVIFGGVANVSLSALGLPQGVWVKFSPTTVSPINASESKATMTLAGAVAAHLNSPKNRTITIKASDGSTNANLPLQIYQTDNLTILRSAGAIQFLNSIITNANSTSFQEYGIVLDSGPKNSGNLSIKLGVLGLNENGAARSLPLWLRVVIPTDSFTVGVGDPYYFIVAVNTLSSPTGSYEITISESVNGQSFSQDITLLVAQTAVV